MSTVIFALQKEGAMSTVIFGVFVACVLMMSVVAAHRGLRQKYLGESKARNALVPVIAAAIAWIAAIVQEYPRTLFSDSVIPRDNLHIFVEDISFGLPQIGDEYQKYSLTKGELERILRPFRNSKENLSLTTQETDAINLIAYNSSMVDRVRVDRVYSLPDIAELLYSAISFNYEYSNWGAVCQHWSEAMGKGPINGTDAERLAFLLKFAREEMSRQLDAAGLMQGVVGMSMLGQIKIDPSPSAAIGSGVRYDKGEQKHILYFETFGMVLVTTSSEPQRIETAQMIADLFTSANIGDLSEILKKARDIFQAEAKLQKEYVDAWNTVLSSRKSKSITLDVSVSNIGKYSSFIRSKAKVSIGPRGGKTEELLDFVITLKADGGSEAESDAPFFSVESRSTRTVQLTASLDDALKERVHGTYIGGLTYLRIGVLVSAGSYEDVVLSTLVPFSTEARAKAGAAIAEMEVPLN